MSSSAQRSSAAPAGDAPGRTGSLRRITVATAFGEGLDGYDLGVISVVLPLASTALDLTTVEEGLLGASSLAGIFFGAPIFGYLTDRFGRRKIFILDLIAFVILGALQGVVDSAPLLLALRFALGLAIGAEYAIGQTMLAEFVPSEGRGRRLSSLQASWYGGFLLAVVVAYILDGLGVSWQLILATGAIPGLATLLLRQGLPESPRWLASRGREDEAKEIVDEHLGGDYYEDEDLGDENTEPASFARLFARDTWRSTAFASIFFTCLVAPYFGDLHLLCAQVFSSLGFDSPKVLDHRHEHGRVPRRARGDGRDRALRPPPAAADLVLGDGRHDGPDRLLERRTGLDPVLLRSGAPPSSTRSPATSPASTRPRSSPPSCAAASASRRR